MLTGRKDVPGDRSQTLTGGSGLATASEFWKGLAAPITVQIEPVTGHRLVIGFLDAHGFVLDDETQAKRLGLLDHLDYFGINIGGQLNVLLAGVDPLAKHVTVKVGSSIEVCTPRQGAWMSTLRPFVSGVQVRIDWHHDDDHLRFTTIGPLTAEQLSAGSSWTFYANPD